MCYRGMVTGEVAIYVHFLVFVLYMYLCFVLYTYIRYSYHYLLTILVVSSQLPTMSCQTTVYPNHSTNGGIRNSKSMVDFPTASHYGVSI
jgi:hypothetical protein